MPNTLSNTINTRGGDMVVAVDTYTYQVPFNTGELDANTTGSKFLTIEADTDFVLRKFTYKSFDAFPLTTAELQRGNVFIPYLTIQITDTGSGRQWFELPAPITNIFGTGELPFIFREPPTLFARSKYLFEVQNFGSIDVDFLRLSLTGSKIYLTGAN